MSSVMQGPGFGLAEGQSSAITAINVEFSPGTGGLGSPYIHVYASDITPNHIFVTNATPEVALAIVDFHAAGRHVELSFTDEHQSDTAWTASLKRVVLA